MASADKHIDLDKLYAHLPMYLVSHGHCRIKHISIEIIKKMLLILYRKQISMKFIRKSIQFYLKTVTREFQQRLPFNKSKLESNNETLNSDRFRNII